ncbi:MAG: cyclic nucleotide-binding domain-containing protein [Pseudomonadales bacterium]|nr:cyclic nucleotide-binding domain-containing protein [Pseudomonadales bacterium]
MNQPLSVSQSQNNVNQTIIASTLNSRARDANLTVVPKTTCPDCRLSDLCLARELDAAGLSDVGKFVRNSKRLRKGQHLFRQDDEFHSIYFIRSGFAKSYINNSGGDEVAVSFFFPGEMIGLDGLHDGRHTASIVALEDTHICELPYKALSKVMASSPGVRERFNALLSRQIVQEQAMTMLRGQKSASDQLKAFLLNLSERYARIRLSPISFRLPMTRKDIAGCLNLTIETVSRLFSQFQEQNLVEVSGREITLTDLQRFNS